MATIGLRTGLRGPAMRNIAATLYAAAPVSRQRISASVAHAALGSIRHHSHPREEHFVANEFGLLSDFMPIPWSERPSLLSKKGIICAKDHIVEWARGAFSLLTMKWYLTGWKSPEFAKQSEDLYCLMNEAFAKGDLKTLNSICFPNMYASLKNDIKRRKTNFHWSKLSSLNPPKVVQVRTGRLTSDFAIGQVVVLIDQEQVVAPISKKAGSKSSAASKKVHTKEYVVFQRVVTDVNSPWCIYGKLNIPNSKKY